AEDHPEQWQQTWHSYLLEQLNSGQYISYQEVALLWAMLFPEQQEQQALADCILRHYNGNTAHLKRHAQRLIAGLSDDLRYLRNFRKSRDLRELSTSSYLRYSRDLRAPRYLSNLRDLRDLRDLRSLRDLGSLRDF